MAFQYPQLANGSFRRKSDRALDGAPRYALADQSEGDDVSNLAVVRSIYEAFGKGDVPAVLGNVVPTTSSRSHGPTTPRYEPGFPP